MCVGDRRRVGCVGDPFARAHKTSSSVYILGTVTLLTPKALNLKPNHCYTHSSTKNAEPVDLPEDDTYPHQNCYYGCA